MLRSSFYLELNRGILYFWHRFSSHTDLRIGCLIRKSSRIILFLVRMNLSFLNNWAYLSGREGIRRTRAAPTDFSQSTLEFLYALSSLFACCLSIVLDRICICSTLHFFRQFFNQSENGLV